MYQSMKLQEDQKTDYTKLIHILEQTNPMDEIALKRNMVADLFQKGTTNVTQDCILMLTEVDLKLLFQLYNEIFFGNALDDFGGKFQFSLSRRMTRSAGMTICPKNRAIMKEADVVLEIRMGLDFFLHYHGLSDEKSVGGIRTDNALQALLLVFEHELCHAVEFILFHKSSCKADRFRTIAHRLFGHTESSHQLPTFRRIAQQTMNLNLGDQVSFEYDDRRLNGLLYKINKRAVVMVKDRNGNMVDKQGNRYAKYYVPLDRLKKI